MGHIQSKSMNQNEEALYANRAIEMCESDIQMQDSLFMDAIFAKEHGLDNDAMDAILEYISRLPAGKPPEVFGYSGAPGHLQLTAISKNAPKIFLALQFVIRNFFRVNDVVAVRLGKSLSQVKKCEYAERSVLIHYTSDTNPDFHYYETNDTALDLNHIAGSNKSRIIQCLVQHGSINILRANAEIVDELSQTQPRNN